LILIEKIRSIIVFKVNDVLYDLSIFIDFKISIYLYSSINIYYKMPFKKTMCLLFVREKIRYGVDHFVASTLQHIVLPKALLVSWMCNFCFICLIKFTDSICRISPNDSPIFPHFILQCISLPRSTDVTSEALQLPFDRHALPRSSFRF